jgi:hypothetical protein
MPGVPSNSEVRSHTVRSPRLLCPYLDRRDARCADLLTLTNLQQAFRLCAGDHESCTIYHQIRFSDMRLAGAAPIAQSA